MLVYIYNFLSVLTFHIRLAARIYNLLTRQISGHISRDIINSISSELHKLSADLLYPLAHHLIRAARNAEPPFQFSLLHVLLTIMFAEVF